MLPATSPKTLKFCSAVRSTAALPTSSGGLCRFRRRLNLPLPPAAVSATDDSPPSKPPASTDTPAATVLNPTRVDVEPPPATNSPTPTLRSSS
ncbi:unnamed protein product, partial [Ectocarpus fasciculatus]